MATATPNLTMHAAYAWLHHGRKMSSSWRQQRRRQQQQQLLLVVSVALVSVWLFSCHAGVGSTTLPSPCLVTLWATWFRPSFGVSVRVYVFFKLSPGGGLILNWLKVWNFRFRWWCHARGKPRPVKSHGLRTQNLYCYRVEETSDLFSQLRCTRI